MKNLISKNKLLSKIFFLIAILLVGCTDSNKTVTNLYKFPVTKDVKVQVNIEYKLDLGGGPAVEVGSQDFLLNAFLLENGVDEKIEIGYLDAEPLADLPVTLTGTHLSFDAVVRLPIMAQPGSSGYALHFALKEKSTATSLNQAEVTNVKNLEALRGGIQPGTAASANDVTLSLATTLAYQFTRSAEIADGSSNHVVAYQALLNTINVILKDVEGTINASLKPDLQTFATAVLASIKLDILNDTSVQNKIAESVQTAVSAKPGNTGTTAFADTFTNTLKTYALEVKEAFTDPQSPVAQIFTAGPKDPATLPNPEQFNEARFTPAGLAFIDEDFGITLKGSVLITPPPSEAGIQSYAVYFGGESEANSRLKLAGTVLKGVSPLAVALAAGTEIPANATKFWVYPVISGKELNRTFSLAFVNIIGSSQPVLSISNGPFFDYGPNVLSASIPHTFTVTNTSSSSATLGLITPTGLSLTDDFVITGGTCATGQVLAGGAKCNIILAFRPLLAQVFDTTAKLLYSSNGSSYTASVGLKGRVETGYGVKLFAGIVSPTVCLLTTDGRPWCWGQNRGAAHFVSPETNLTMSFHPRPYTGLTKSVISIGQGFDHVCFVYADSTAECFGQNSSGQLGNKDLDTGATNGRVVVQTESGQALTGIKLIEGNMSSTCALTNDGKVYCWGSNDSGQLGTPFSVGQRSFAAPVTGITNAIGIAVNTVGACALLTGGSVKCWGDNSAGQLGDGTSNTTDTPVDVIGLASPAVSIGGGYSTMCALESDGRVQCWGGNYRGQIGNGNDTNSSTPLYTSGLSNVSSMVTSDESSCAIVGTGLKCWGYNGGGNLGIGNYTDSLIPVDVQNLLPSPLQVEAGYHFTCTLHSENRVQCWGNGAIGIAGTIDSTTYPVTVTPIGETVATKLSLEKNSSTYYIIGSATACMPIEAKLVTADDGYVTNFGNPLQINFNGSITKANVPSIDFGLYSNETCTTAASSATIVRGAGSVSLFAKVFYDEFTGEFGSETFSMSAIPTESVLGAPDPLIFPMVVLQGGT